MYCRLKTDSSQESSVNLTILTLYSLYTQETIFVCHNNDQIHAYNKLAQTTISPYFYNSKQLPL